MISRIVLTRIEPCFTANKKNCGETSRVKKETISPDQKPQYTSQWEKDTFTASNNAENSKENITKNNKSNDKYTHKGN